MRSLLTAADLMELTADLTEMQTKARKIEGYRRHKEHMLLFPTTLQVSSIDRLMIMEQSLSHEPESHTRDTALCRKSWKLCATQGCQTWIRLCQASKELIELQDLHNPRAGEDWKTAAW